MSEAVVKSDVAVKTVGVTKEYQMGGTILRALKGVDVEIKRGEYISIMGPSGSGKSTLFNMIGALDRPTAGTVYIDDVSLRELSPAEIAWLRCWKIGYIFQSFNLIPVMTALENVTLPMIFAGLSSSERKKKGMETD
jgi:putative ABC transport system ATP-binding protein